MRNARMAIQTEGRRLALCASRRRQLLLWLVGWSSTIAVRNNAEKILQKCTHYTCLCQNRITEHNELSASEN
jgi:hypothetical protein